MKVFPPFRLDTVNQCLWRNTGAEDERIFLRPKGFQLLHYPVEHAGRLVTQGELLGAVWPGTVIEGQAVKKQMFDLRRALDDESRNPRSIETLPRRGYRFVRKVEESSPPIPLRLPSAGSPAGRA